MGMKISIFDTTLRDGEQAPGCSMDISEKLEVARQLERLRVDCIEAGFAIASPGDLAAVKAVSEQIKGCRVASLCRCVEKDIDAARDALSGAVSPLIHLFLATSPIHMRAKLKMTPEQVLEQAVGAVKYARRFCEGVQFSAEDACRSDPVFLRRIFSAVIEAGATVINIPDTVGYITPNEYYRIVRDVLSSCPGADKVVISAHCHNDLGMATANSISGVAAGASQVECTLNGIGERAGNTPLEEVVMAIVTRGSTLDVSCDVDTTQIYRASRLIQTITGLPIPPNKAVIGANAFAHEAGIHQHGVMANPETYEIMRPEALGIPQNRMVLGKHSGRHAFEERLEALGFSVSKEELDEAFASFKVLADKKKTVSDLDIIALMKNEADEDFGLYRLESFVINSGNTIDSTAIIKLTCGDSVVQRVEMGDGPVDAAFKAINAIAGGRYKLENYSLHSITEGGDALGEALVRVSSMGRIYTGRGLSTDVIEASIKAYVNAVNKCLMGGAE